MSGDMFCGSRLIKQDIYHIVSTKAPASTQDVLCALVVIPIGKPEFKIAQRVITITRKCPCNLFHILFCVVAFTQNKEFHKLARQVLIRTFRRVISVIQIVQHGRITHQLLQYEAKVPGSMRAQHVMLLCQRKRFLFKRRVLRHEEVVPDQKKTLASRSVSRQHFAHPPQPESPHFHVTRCFKSLAFIGFVVPPQKILHIRPVDPARRRQNGMRYVELYHHPADGLAACKAQQAFNLRRMCSDPDTF